MYDELVKRLWECASGECFNCSQYTETTNASVCSKELMKQAADAIEELRKPKWIPVEERLPDAGKRVLCYCRANIYEVMKMRTDGAWVHNDQVYDSTYMGGFVKHWMPLPEPPKEET